MIFKTSEKFEQALLSTLLYIQTHRTFEVGKHYGSFDNLAETHMHLYDSLVITAKYRLRQQIPFEVYSYSQLKDDIRIHFTDVYLPIEANASERALILSRRIKCLDLK